MRLTVRRQHQMVYLPRVGISDGAAQRVRMKDDIGIRKQQPLSLCLLPGDLQRMVFAQPAGRQFRDMQDAQARVFCRQPFQNHARRIVRAVIDSDDLHAGVLERQQTSHPALDGLGLVAGGNHDGERGQ